MPKNAILFIPVLLLIGLGLGAANYAAGMVDNLGQSLIQNTVTSLLIGFPLLVMVEIYITIRTERIPRVLLYLFMLISFSIIGLVATEIEMMISMTVFAGEKFQLFSGGGVYAFNVIISNILGFAFIHNLKLIK